MEVFLQDLATKPYASQKNLLGARMRNFLGLPPPQRKQAISGLLDALGNIPEDARVKVVKARTDIMMEIPKEHRKTLMGVLGEVMSTWTPQRKNLEKRAVMLATEDYMFLKRMMIRKKFSKLLQ